MGVRLESSNILLPSSKLLLAVRRRFGSDPEGAAYPSGSPGQGPSTKKPRSLVSRIRTVLLVLNLFAEEWYRLMIARFYQWRGNLVLFERHFIADYYAFKAADPNSANELGTRVHGLILENLYPEPDLVILLDGLPDVIFSRKKEGTVDRLHKLLQGYKAYGKGIDHFEEVDTVGNNLPEVVKEVKFLIHRYLQKEPRSKESP